MRALSRKGVLKCVYLNHKPQPTPACNPYPNPKPQTPNPRPQTPYSAVSPCAAGEGVHAGPVQEGGTEVHGLAIRHARPAGVSPPLPGFHCVRGMGGCGFGSAVGSGLGLVLGWYIGLGFGLRSGLRVEQRFKPVDLVESRSPSRGSAAGLRLGLRVSL